jgi:hypothetical protein
VGNSGVNPKITRNSLMQGTRDSYKAVIVFFVNFAHFAHFDHLVQFGPIFRFLTGRSLG